MEEDYQHSENDHCEDAALDEYVISQTLYTLDEAVDAPKERSPR